MICMIWQKELDEMNEQTEGMKSRSRKAHAGKEGKQSHDDEKKCR